MASQYYRRGGRSNNRQRRQNIFNILKEYEPTVPIQSLYNKKFMNDGSLTKPELDILNLLNNQQLTEENYHNVYSNAIQIEDLHQKIVQSDFAFVNCEFKSVDSEDVNKYKFEFRKDELLPLFVNKQHKIQLFDESVNVQNPKMGIYFYANIKFMIFSMDEQINLDRKYTIRFVPNRLTYRLEHWALEKAKKLKLVKYLFEPTFSGVTFVNNSKLNYVEKTISNNPEQRKAIEAIVQAKSSNPPFLLIGYPGSGKTQVIVESIHQLLMNDPNNRILVCSGINDVLDEIALRLQKSLFSTANETNSSSTSTTISSSATTNNIQPNKKILRYYASAYEDRITDINLLGISNLDENNKSNTNLKEAIQETHVVLCTFAMSGRIALANIEQSYFTHLFIDEAQSATEPSALIPIAGLCATNNQMTTRIILAGDTKQLGPVVCTDEARCLGYGLSMMERLLNCGIYQSHPKTKLYNPLLVCKLIRNYRSHPEILKIPNELFYNNEMISCVSQEKTPRKEVKQLPTTSLMPKEFPKRFYSVYGFAETETECTSWYNRKEINYVVELLRHLLSGGVYKQTEIGIITPYKRQALKIEDRLHQNDMKLVKCGTVRQFMSQEKVSITVILTRAISKLFFIGNTKTLMSNSNWKKVIVDCHEHNAVYMTSG